MSALTCLRAILALLVFLFLGGRAGASCNAVPSAAQTFASTLGATTTPFAGPGDVVVVRRDRAVFAADPGLNRVALRFQPAGGPATSVADVQVLPPEDGSGCEASACTAAGCSCLRFVFPDTDPFVGLPTDARGLTGPVKVKITTAGRLTAVIDALRLAGTPFRDTIFPSFVALPRPNDFGTLLHGPGDLLAAADEAGSLLVPFDFSALVPGPRLDRVSRSQILEARVPGLAAVGAASIEAYTPSGARLPPLIRATLLDDVLGTADAPASVLRLAGGAARAGLAPEEGRGPVVIGGVVADADPRKRADPITLQMNERWVVFENRECGIRDHETQCTDLNHDGDQTDYFLLALDTTTPRADPVVVDQVDRAALGGAAADFTTVFLWVFDATDELVAFRIPELLWDLDGDGRRFELLRTGAFDLRRRTPIPGTAAMARAEVHGSLLAFTRGRRPVGRGTLLVYDAAASDPGPVPVADETHASFTVSGYPGTGLWPFRSIPIDLAVHDGRVAFAADERAMGEDLTGDGVADDLALLTYDSRTGRVTNLRRENPAALLDLTSRWLAFQAVDPAGGAVAAVVPADDPEADPLFACADPIGLSLLAPPISDSMVPCVKDEAGVRDLNGDGDRGDPFVMHVFLPDTPGGPVEHDLAAAVPFSFANPILDSTLTFGVSEAAQRRDLDGDGTRAGLVLHAFHATTQVLVNTGVRLVVSADPFLRPIERGLAAIGPGLVRTLLRDADGDGHFEVPALDPPGLADDCPGVANPGQDDEDRDGIGDACEPMVEGRGAPEGRTCIAEFALLGPPDPLAALGVHGCTDGDPRCDLDDLAGQCTFRATPCLLVPDERYPECARTRPALTGLSIAVHDGVGVPDAAAAAALLTALATLPGAASSDGAVAFSPPLVATDAAACPAPVTVPVPASARRVVTLQSRGTPGAVVERSAVTLGCTPAGGGGSGHAAAAR